MQSISKMEEEDYKEYLATDWAASRPRLLLFADIMGFKAMVKSNTHSQLVGRFRSFINELTKLVEPLETGRHLRLTMFSDSIIMGTDSCTIKNFNIITKAAALLLSLCHSYGLPINGCIACGSLTFDEQIQTPEMEEEIKGKRKVKPYMPLFVGDSVVSAHLLNEELFCYGIVLHPSAEKLLQKSNSHKDDKFHHPFIYIPVPLKSGGYAHLYYLSWTSVPTPKNKDISKDNVKTWLEEIETSLPTRPRTYVYNTLEIINRLPSDD
ncbi:MAG: hypothetical protein K2H85_11850 [Allobaculum sp.]|nr:hypothetical protein [Allobaculum sp.]